MIIERMLVRCITWEQNREIVKGIFLTQIPLSVKGSSKASADDVGSTFIDDGSSS